ncbi:MAG: hypothetical protein HW416_3713, partial [Chloroflexi bacterium]|nr:hypothetical protein [Chloroflexota bacterium]
AHVFQQRCAHRGTQLNVGWVEGDCIRCLYHGWKYDETGQCIEQPGEDEEFATRVKIRSYPTEEYLGLIFVYLGEGETPPLRRFPDFERDFVIDAGIPEYWPCNYFNRIDNACDAAHVAYAHRTSLTRVGREPFIRPISTEETDYGLRTTLNLPGGAKSYIHFHMPNVNQTRSSGRVEGTLEDAKNLWVDRLFFRVPVDDGHNISFVVDCLQLTGAAADAYRERRLAAQEMETNDLNQIGEDILGGKMRMMDIPQMSTYKSFWIEDYTVQVGQGLIAPRENDRPIRGDVGVVMLRKIWERELLKFASGRPTKQWHTPAGLADMSEVPAG